MTNAEKLQIFCDFLGYQNVKLIPPFLVSLDAINIIEQKLSPDQLVKYTTNLRILVDADWKTNSKSVSYCIAKVDKRVEALIQTLKPV